MPRFVPTSLKLATLLLPLTLAGCGGGDASSTSSGPASGTVPGPHGGPAVPLPGEKGYAEVTLDRTGAKPGSGQAKVVVYFLNKDLKAALTPAPTGVSVKAIPPTGEPVTLSLKADAGDGKPDSAGRFISPASPVDFDELRGDVVATVDGQPVTVSFAFR